MDLSKLRGENRLLLEARLRPVQGDRFQPTGFPDLGPATYTLPDGTEKLLVESPQSVANRLETVCWDESSDDLVPELRGMPFVKVVDEQGRVVTNSILEAHRLNSPYILESEDRGFFNTLKKELEAASGLAADRRLLARTVFKYDPNAVLHGVFLAKKELAGGRFRLPRLLSGFVEAVDVRMAESGGVKNDRVNPSGDTKKGFGNVPFHRAEFVAADIRAFFNLDLVTLRGYGLGQAAERFLVLLSLWKVQAFLGGALRLRTACDLEVAEMIVTRPKGFDLPAASSLSSELQKALPACDELFAKSRVTEVRWKPPKESPRKPKASTGDGDTGKEGDTREEGDSQ